MSVVLYFKFYHLHVTQLKLYIHKHIYLIDIKEGFRFWKDGEWKDGVQKGKFFLYMFLKALPCL